MPKGYVLRCPDCGSTDVWCDESRSFVDISCFCCRTCNFEDYCDSWQRDHDWYAPIELAEGEAVPAKLAPLPPDQRFVPLLAAAREKKPE